MHFNHFAKALAKLGIIPLTLLQLISFVTVSLVSGETRTRYVRGNENHTLSPDPQSTNRTVFDSNANGALDRLIEVLHGDTEFKNALFSDPLYSSHTGQDNAIHYTNEWLVHVNGGDQEVKRIADEAGFENIGQVEGFPDVYLLRKPDHPSGLKESAEDLTSQLMSYREVNWADQQFAKLRVTRDLDITNLINSLDFGSRFSTADDLLKRTFHVKPSATISFTDPLWANEWYIQDTKTAKSLPRRDLNVIPVFKMGYTGKGVKVVILDDGLEHDHKDLKKNYIPSISFDLNDNDTDPTPRYNPPRSHGTRCAGEVAMQANNSKCGVGIAYNVGIGGVRMLDGDVSDRIEGVALTFANQKVDIYSASWGPDDSGTALEGPGRLTQGAFLKGVIQGRNGLGSIYVWASGNGGDEGDCCGCDGYASSIFTLSIGSATQSGSFPTYGEKCASTLAVTYSGGEYPDKKIATTELRNGCNRQFSGTSASTPLAAGIIALALEANPKLTWRDVQHLTVWTSRPGPLMDNPNWRVNAAGLHYNHRFGFGLMDAHGMVKNALNWTTVPALKICRVKALPIDNPKIDPSRTTVVKFLSVGCQGSENEVNYLEHVQLTTSIQYSRRGALEIHLISPKETETKLLFPRVKDVSSAGFKNWPFISTHTWGENPTGMWKVFITDPSAKSKNKGKVENMELVLYGTRKAPKYTLSGPRVYPQEY